MEKMQKRILAGLRGVGFLAAGVFIIWLVCLGWAGAASSTDATVSAAQIVYLWPIFILAILPFLIRADGEKGVDKIPNKPSRLASAAGAQLR